MNKKQRGITLIALIITVIVMLILAGVAINLTVGDNGIFKKSKEGAQIYQNSSNNEASSLNEADKEMGDLINQYTTGNSQGGADTGEDEDAAYTMVEGIPVPKGFTHTTGTKATGFVIKNDTDGNEFVWIPVEEDSGYTYAREAFSSDTWEYSQTVSGVDETTNSNIISCDLGDFTEDIPTDEIESVNEHKGYYIGRYEAGIEIQRNSSATTPTAAPKSQAGMFVYNYITPNQAITLAGGLYNKESDFVTSKLCSGYAWDTALKFIQKQNANWATSSQNGVYEVEAPEKTGNYGVNNIYDMAGNVAEFTPEKNSDTEYPATSRRRKLQYDSRRRTSSNKGWSSNSIR